MAGERLIDLYSTWVIRFKGSPEDLHTGPGVNALEQVLHPTTFDSQKIPFNPTEIKLFVVALVALPNATAIMNDWLKDRLETAGLDPIWMLRVRFIVRQQLQQLTQIKV
ncbi:MAG: hypothetical protein Q7S31_03300 [bacterium]|nr:hypothetical protein [bacterium]